MTPPEDRPLRGLRTTSLGTLVSRLLGLARDIATAALLGMSAAMDALVLAFRLPDLFRRFFGEGVLTASYVPVVAQKRLTDRRQLWQLTATTMVALAGLVTSIVLLLELLLWGVEAWSDVFSGGLTTQLTSIVLPYVIFICLTAQLASTLHACGHFAAPAVAPILINVVWLIAVVWIAPNVAADDKPAQVRVIAMALLIGGVLQFATQLWALRQHGFRLLVNFTACAADLRRIAKRMLPAMLGLAAIQINTFVDSLYAWYLSSVQQSLEQGAVAATYFAERMYMFPVGMIGVAVATASYPKLSELAAQGKQQELNQRLSWGIQLNALLAIPATVGLILLAEPITRVLFEHGEFGPIQSQRVARVIAGYACGLWAFCTLPLLVRVFYALGDYRIPAIAGSAGIGINLAANAWLVQTWQEAGLGVATSMAAFVQIIALAIVMRGRGTAPLLQPILLTIGKSVLTTAIMAAAILAARPLIEDYLPKGQLLALVLVGMAVYLSISWFLQRAVVGQLLHRKD